MKVAYEIGMRPTNKFSICDSKFIIINMNHHQIDFELICILDFGHLGAEWGKRHQVLRVVWRAMSEFFMRLALCFSQSEPLLWPTSRNGSRVEQTWEHGTDAE
jgi:hypothetical protein